jgi:hypothetical protein
VEYDHIDLDANSKDNSLGNCAAVCIPCHRFKTAKHDTPKAAKTLRQQDKARGVTRPKQSIRGPGFAKAPRVPKPSLPPRRIYALVGPGGGLYPTNHDEDADYGE